MKHVNIIHQKDYFSWNYKRLVPKRIVKRITARFSLATTNKLKYERAKILGFHVIITRFRLASEGHPRCSENY